MHRRCRPTRSSLGIFALALSQLAWAHSKAVGQPAPRVASYRVREKVNNPKFVLEDTSLQQPCAEGS
jgi:hypothetical protein